MNRLYKVRPIYILAAILVIATIYFYQDPQSNGNSRLAVTRAIVERGSLQIDWYMQQTSWQSLDKALYNGHYYGDKAIGSWLIAVPIYFVIYKLFGLLGGVLIKHSLTTLVLGSAFVANGFVLYRIASLVTRNAWKAMLATLGVSLGTMLWPYSAVFYGHVLAAMFLASAFYLLFAMKMGHAAEARWPFFWAGLAMGFAFITDYTSAFIIAGLIVYTLHFLRGGGVNTIVRSGLTGLLGAIIPLSMLIAYNMLVYKVPWAFGYSHEAYPLFERGHATGLLGIGIPNLIALYHITVDPQFGLFWQSPVLVLAALGYIHAFRSKVLGAESVLSLYAITSLVLMNAGYYLWWGGSAFGPRLLIVALPFFIIPLALVPDKLTWLLGMLAALSAGQMLIPLLGKVQIGLEYDATKDQFSVNQPFNGFSILYQYGIPIIIKLHGKDTLPWTLGSALGLPYRFSAALLVGVEAALVGWLYKVTRSKAAINAIGTSPVGKSATQ